MVDFLNGDIVSLSREQLSVVDVLVLSAGPAEVFTVELSYQGRTNLFTWTAVGGETPAQIAAAIADLLSAEQTYLGVELDVDRVYLSSPYGESFEGTTSANLSIAIVYASTRFELDGRAVTRCKVLESNNDRSAMRIFWTRLPAVGFSPGEVVRVQRLTLRELNYSTLLDVNATEVAALVSSEG